MFDEDTYRISRRLGRNIANSANTASSECKCMIKKSDFDC